MTMPGIITQLLLTFTVPSLIPDNGEIKRFVKISGITVSSHNTTVPYTASKRWFRHMNQPIFFDFLQSLLKIHKTQLQIFGDCAFVKTIYNILYNKLPPSPRGVTIRAHARLSLKIYLFYPCNGQRTPLIKRT